MIATTAADRDFPCTPATPRTSLGWESLLAARIGR
jgi:hypothetical protein